MNRFQVAAKAKLAPTFLIFFFFLCLYLLTASGHIESIDGNVMFVVTQNIVRFGDLHPHSPYGLALSLVAIPFYLVGRAITHVLHFSGDFPTKAVVSLTNAPLTALSCALIASIAQRLVVHWCPAIILALVYGTCTLAWPYAKTFFSEPLTALWLLAAFWALLHVSPPYPSPDRKAVRHCSDHAALWSGGAMLALGLALLTRETTLIVLPVFAVYLATRIRLRSDKTRLILVATTTIAVCLAGVAMWNAARFGNVFATGYNGHLWTVSLVPGLYGLLISPYKGLILYVPLTIIAFLSWPRFYRQWPAEALLCGGVVLVYLIVHAAYTDWPGGGNWGPRFLVPALPFLLFALPFGWTRSPRWMAATVILCMASLLVQLPAIYVSYARYYPMVGTRDDRALLRITDYHPLLTPIVEQWRSVPVVTAHLCDGLPSATTDLTQKISGQATSTLPPHEVLRRSVTVNLPDFWFVYLALSGYLSRLVRLVVALLALAVLFSGLALGQALRRAHPSPPGYESVVRTV